MIQMSELAIAVLSIALAFGRMFAIAQLRSNSIYQPIPTLPQSR